MRRMLVTTSMMAIAAAALWALPAMASASTVSVVEAKTGVPYKVGTAINGASYNNLVSFSSVNYHCEEVKFAGKLTNNTAGTATIEVLSMEAIRNPKWVDSAQCTNASENSFDLRVGFKVPGPISISASGTVGFPLEVTSNLISRETGVAINECNFKGSSSSTWKSGTTQITTSGSLSFVSGSGLFCEKPAWAQNVSSQFNLTDKAGHEVAIVSNP